MTRFYFDFNHLREDRSDEQSGVEIPTLEAAIIAAAASLALTAAQSGEGKAKTVVLIGDDAGPKARVELSITVDKLT